MAKNKSLLCAIALLASGGCGLTCPEVDGKPSPLLSGTYEGNVNDHRGAGVTVTKTVVVNREAGTATVSFVRQGKQVVETWKLTPLN